MLQSSVLFEGQWLEHAFIEFDLYNLPKSIGDSPTDVVALTKFMFYGDYLNCLLDEQNSLSAPYSQRISNNSG